MMLCALASTTSSSTLQLPRLTLGLQPGGQGARGGGGSWQGGVGQAGAGRWAALLVKRSRRLGPAGRRASAAHQTRQGSQWAAGGRAAGVRATGSHLTSAWCRERAADSAMRAWCCAARQPLTSCGSASARGTACRSGQAAAPQSCSTCRRGAGSCRQMHHGGHAGVGGGLGKGGIVARCRRAGGQLAQWQERSACERHGSWPQGRGGSWVKGWPAPAVAPKLLHQAFQALMLAGGPLLNLALAAGRARGAAAAAAHPHLQRRPAVAGIRGGAWRAGPAAAAGDG